MFDGQHRQKPIQNFGRNDKTMTRQETIRRAAEERLQREIREKQKDSAVIIQSWCRTHFERKKLRDILRLEFDSEIELNVLPVTSLLSLLKKFICIHKLGKDVEDKDGKRLICLCLKILQMSGEMCEMMMKKKMNDEMMQTRSDEMRSDEMRSDEMRSDEMMTKEEETISSYLNMSIKKVLEICCRFISLNAINEGISLEVPLKMLKIFTSFDIFMNHHSSYGVHALHIVADMKQHLCHNGYFSSLKLLIDHRISINMPGSSDDLKATVLDLLNRFLLAEEEPIRNAAYKKAAEELFSQHVTNQMKGFLLPTLANIFFPFLQMLKSFLCQQANDTSWNLTSIQSLNLLFTILIMGRPHFGKMEFDDFSIFFDVIANLICHLNEEKVYESKFIREENEEEEEEDDDDELGDYDYKMVECPDNNMEEKMDWMSDQEASEKKLKRRCFEMLGNDNNICNYLTTLLNNFNGCPSFKEKAISSLCRICYNLIGPRINIATQHYRILRVLGFNCIFIRNIWELLNTSIPGCDSYLTRVSRALTNTDVFTDLPLLSTFCNCYSYHLETMSDADLSREEANIHTRPFSGAEELSKVSLTLRNCCLGLLLMANLENRQHSMEGLPSDPSHDRSYDLFRVFKETVALTRQLYERNCRLKFCPSKDWVAQGWTSDLLSPNCRSFLDCNIWSNLKGRFPLSESSKLIVLRELPFIINFSERVEFFRNLVSKNKLQPTFGLINHNSTIRIRRDYMYEDAFQNIQEPQVPDMKAKLHFMLISPLGLEEPGIDGGGIFRETLREIIKAGFNPDLGFFQATSEGMLYPNHLAEYAHKDYLKHFFFLGKILGKAIFARLLVDLPLASFFLVKLLSQETTRLDIHHLSSLDPELHKGLLCLRDPSEDIKEQELYFDTSYDVLGAIRTVELKLNGSSIQVENHNKFEYIHLVADWHLNKKIRKHCLAFRRGLASVVNIDWLRMFDHNELQFLISGANLPIDLDDLKRHTNYTGGYTVDHELINNFWSVLEEFTEIQRQEFLKFVTCSPRAPLYGFKELRPSFCIHLAGTETDRLPTSSTCMNLLKLPAFKDRETLKEKLLKAIELGAGFELS